MSDLEFTIEQINEPAMIALHQAQRERAQRNSDWLQAHWPELLPQARGRFVAVAGQEAFIADTAQEAWSRAKAAHPEDDGVLCQYVFQHTGPRFYGHRRAVADL